MGIPLRLFKRNKLPVFHSSFEVPLQFSPCLTSAGSVIMPPFSLYLVCQIVGHGLVPKVDLFDCSFSSSSSEAITNGRGRLMPGGTRTFRVFVSSTFSDFEAEREALRRKVFPRLREFCRARAASFQAVDLRWGVSREAAESHQTIGICLKEIERCQALTSQPNFIVLLGDRYGWRPLPEIIPAEEFLWIDQWLLATRPLAAELLHRTYTRDDNAVPSLYRICPG